MQRLIMFNKEVYQNSEAASIFNLISEKLNSPASKTNIKILISNLKDKFITKETADHCLARILTAILCHQDEKSFPILLNSAIYIASKSNNNVKEVFEKTSIKQEDGLETTQNKITSTEKCYEYLFAQEIKEPVLYLINYFYKIERNNKLGPNVMATADNVLSCYSNLCKISPTPETSEKLINKVKLGTALKIKFLEFLNRLEDLIAQNQQNWLLHNQILNQKVTTPINLNQKDSLIYKNEEHKNSNNQNHEKILNNTDKVAKKTNHNTPTKQKKQMLSNLKKTSSTKYY